MMTKNADKKREQMMMFSMDSMVLQDHMLRLIDKAINWNFIYDLVEDKYCQNNGRPSMDPVMLIKIPFIQYLYGIKSMRQTIREIEVNVAYRWFLGLDMLDPVPHFSTFGNRNCSTGKATGRHWPNWKRNTSRPGSTRCCRKNAGLTGRTRPMPGLPCSTGVSSRTGEPSPATIQSWSIFPPTG